MFIATILNIEFKAHLWATVRTCRSYRSSKTITAIVFYKHCVPLGLLPTSSLCRLELAEVSAMIRVKD